MPQSRLLSNTRSCVLKDAGLSEFGPQPVQLTVNMASTMTAVPAFPEATESERDP